jgi:hypothetical protein
MLEQPHEYHVFKPCRRYSIFLRTSTPHDQLLLAYSNHQLQLATATYNRQLQPRRRDSYKVAASQLPPSPKCGPRTSKPDHKTNPSLVLAVQHRIAASQLPPSPKCGPRTDNCENQQKQTSTHKKCGAWRVWRSGLPSFLTLSSVSPLPQNHPPRHLGISDM